MAVTRVLGAAPDSPDTENNDALIRIAAIVFI